MGLNADVSYLSSTLLHDVFGHPSPSSTSPFHDLHVMKSSQSVALQFMDYFLYSRLLFRFCAVSSMLSQILLVM